MGTRRIERLNSLLKEVISEVIRREVKDPKIPSLITITQVSLSNDMHHAKVSVSVIGDEKEKIETLNVLNSAAGFIAHATSKKVVMRIFPKLSFLLDNSVETQIRINDIIEKIETERSQRDEEH